MLRPAIAVSAAVLLAGCTWQNASLNRVQLNGATRPFPENYQSEAARAVSVGGGYIATAQVSYPMPALGTTALAPQRWYSCVRGMPTTSTPAPNLEQTIGAALGQRPGISETVLFFSDANGRASVRSGFDSPLCRDVKYEAILAEVPLS